MFCYVTLCFVMLYDMIWYAMIYDMIWYMIWYDVWYDIWYDIWYDMIRCMIWYMICFMLCCVRIRYVTLCLLRCIMLYIYFLSCSFFSLDNGVRYKQEDRTTVPCFDYHAAVVILLPKRSVSLSRENILMAGGRIGVHAHVWSWYSLSWLNANMYTKAHNVLDSELAEASPGLTPCANIYETYLPHRSTSVCHFLEACVLKCAIICPLRSNATCDFCRSPCA